MKRLLKIVNYVFATVLLLAYVAPLVSPQIAWPLAFLGLIFPVLVGINLLFFVFWLSVRKWYFMISLLVLLIGVNPISRTYQLNGQGDDGPGKKQKASKQDELTLLSYNVRIFGLVGSNQFGHDQEKLFELIRSQDPDVVCFQEFYISPRKGLTLEKIQRQLPGLNHHHVVWLTRGDESRYGIATFSRYPIVNKGRIGFERSYNASIYTDMLIDKRRIRVFNNHLQSIRFNRQDYQFITNQNQYNESQKLKALQDISFRLRDAFIKRGRQAEQISRHIRRSSYPLLVCGDFNDTPVSYTYKTLRYNLKDAFMEAGQGMGITYKGQFPSFRIDYIFYHPSFRVTRFNVPQAPYSDHYPVTATFRIK